MSITPLQQKIYAYIKAYLEEHEYSPSLTEIAEGIGISPKSVSLISRSIHTLVASQHLKFDKKGYRNLALAMPAVSQGLPFLGRIAAGAPIEAIEDRHYINFADYFSGENCFILQVKGDSMMDESILDGDYVICKYTAKAKEGDIIVALIDKQEATLKRISYKIKDRVTLVPANSELKPKAYLPHRVEVQGVFTGLLRVPGR